MKFEKVLRKEVVNDTVIELIKPERYEVRHGSYVTYLKTREEAEKFFEKCVREIKAERELRSSEKVFKIFKGMWVQWQIWRYIDYLKKQLNYIKKSKDMSEAEKRVVEEKRKLLKEIISDLQDFINIRKKHGWLSGFEEVEDSYEEVASYAEREGYDISEVVKTLKRLKKEVEKE